MQLIRSSSPYWRLAVSNAAVSADSQKEESLPINIQGKVASIKVKYPEQLGKEIPMPEATVNFKGLTLTEIDGKYFDESKLFHIYLGWYSFFGLSAKAYKVAWGSIAKADVTYDKAGYSMSLVLKPYGANFLNRPLDDIDYKEFESFSLEDILKFIAHLSGMSAVFLGETLVQLIKEDKRLFGEMAEYRNSFNAKAVADRVADLFIPQSQNVADKPKYFSPWLTFITSPKDSTGTKRIVGGYIFPNTAAGLLAYLKSVYFFNIRLEFEYMVFSVTDHVTEVARTVIAPQRFFRYRGGAAGEGYKPTIKEALLEQYTGVLDLDTYDNFTVVSTPQFSDGNRVAVSGTKVAAKKTPQPSAHYNLTHENPVTGELGIQVDKEAAVVKAQSFRANTQARAAEQSVKESPHVLIHVPGATAEVKSYLLQALSHAKTLGQVAKVSGAMGASDVVPGDYFYFDGRFKDTGYYYIIGLEHTIDKRGFTTDFIGKLVEDPKVQEFTKQKLIKVPEKSQAKAKMNRTHIIRVLTKTGIAKVEFPYTYSSGKMKGKTRYVGTRNGREDWEEMTAEGYGTDIKMFNHYQDSIGKARAPEKRKGELVYGVDYITFMVEEPAYQVILEQHKKMVKGAKEGKSKIRFGISERPLSEQEKRHLNTAPRETWADMVADESNFMNNVKGFLCPRSSQ